MAIKGFENHPYIPNSNPTVQAEMLEFLGLKSFDDLHAEVPEEIKLQENLKLEPALSSEYELRRGINKMLNKNQSTAENLSFLGAGCWPHYVPAVCDEIAGRSEFLSGYAGEPYNDLGRFQSLFEYESLVAELVDMEVVNVPTFDWAQAAATAIRMAARINGRSKVLVYGGIDKRKLSVIKNYGRHALDFVLLKYDPKTGQMDLDDLKAKLDEDTACVYFENPAFLGFLETQGQEIADLTHSKGAELVVGVDPSSLGVLEAPRNYGADIVCGELQPLGLHMNFGGGLGGFMATMNDEKYVAEFPSRLFGMAPTVIEGEYGFGDIYYDRTSFGNLREKGKEYVGTQAAMAGIVSGVYLALMGPVGMQELGQNVIQKNLYAQKKLAELPGVKAPHFDNAVYCEFVVDFNGTGKTVAEINKHLLERDIFGGLDLSSDFPELGQSALYCFTEVHLQEDIDRLVAELRDILGK
ncbi:MAG: aminomethyl-transferring glycine dehydrogenase subunit GcvPA [Eubacteriales bacterium]|nr:aminomethyl-transferring glycine dehydrogenase subunit GcvPA [Eubacteriales bacterium]